MLVKRVTPKWTQRTGGVASDTRAPRSLCRAVAEGAPTPPQAKSRLRSALSPPGEDQKPGDAAACHVIVSSPRQGRPMLPSYVDSRRPGRYRGAMGAGRRQLWGSASFAAGVGAGVHIRKRRPDFREAGRCHCALSHASPLWGARVLRVRHPQGGCSRLPRTPNLGLVGRMPLPRRGPSPVPSEPARPSSACFHRPLQWFCRSCQGQ